jgi:uncharacterized protein (DUF58 family)
VAPTSSRFIDPVVLAGLRNLQLVAKIVVDGFLLGVHPSRRSGAGVEFSQHRSYQVGDDLRRVDWKMYARSDRFYVRESDIERSVTVRLILDATASMAHQDGPLSKFDYARFLAASLGYLADRQGDLLGFHAVHDAQVTGLPSRQRQHQLSGLFTTLETLTPSGVWPGPRALEPALASGRGREIVVLVSDLHERGDEIRAMLSKLRALRHEVLVLHLLGRNELDFPYEGDLTFEDLETGALVHGNAQALRRTYLDNLRHELDGVRQELYGRGIAYELLPLDRPLDFALKGFLRRRLELP